MEDRSARINGLTMAVGEPIVLESLELPSHEYRSQDTDNPVGDGTLMGRDRLTPGSLTLNILIVGENAADVNQQMRRLQRAWSTAVDRTKPGAVTSLFWTDGGVTRLMYGRPRALSVINEQSRSGLIQATGSFKLSDALSYDGSDSAVRDIIIRSVPPISGGLIAPLTAPLSSTGYAARQGLVSDTGGVAPTPFWAEFHGPISTPALKLPNATIKLNTNLAWDETITVDTRLGTVRSNLRGNLKHVLDTKARLRDVRLAAGRTELSFEGNDPTGTAWVQVFWRPADYI